MSITGVLMRGHIKSEGLVTHRAHIYDFIVDEKNQRLRALCVGRHAYVSEHIGRFFGEFGLQTKCVVGDEEVLRAARENAPDVILCEYELLTSLPLATWETDEHLAKTSIIGVSLTRRPNESYPLDRNGVAGFLYLPTLDRENALRVINAAALSTRAQYQPASASIPTSTDAETRSTAT